uniref:Uncharacterized protein n=1 Tax=Knipowitschia caucasica TaxID=637954 RepID=A0AAV2J6Q3_KNICA
MDHDAGFLLADPTAAFIQTDHAEIGTRTDPSLAQTDPSLAQTDPSLAQTYPSLAQTGPSLTSPWKTLQSLRLLC